MGVVVDIVKSKLEFEDPQLLDKRTALAGQNFVSYEFFSFKIQFGISFDPDSAKGLGGAPNEAEIWKIGIVQNLLFERYLFEFADGATFRNEFTSPILDFKDSSFDPPFYGSPDLRYKTRPAANIWYTSQGYGELLDPSSPTGVATNNRPEILNTLDQPQNSVVYRRQGSIIRRIEETNTFQAWLVAKKIGPFSSPLTTVRDAFIPSVIRHDMKIETTRVLAHIPAFTLKFWFETDLRNFRPQSSFDTPTFQYGVFVENGISKSPVNHITGIRSPPVQFAMTGDGGRLPILSGPAAVGRSNIWMRSNGLSP
jgi:hypothetical protein